MEDKKARWEAYMKHPLPWGRSADGKHHWMVHESASWQEVISSPKDLFIIGESDPEFLGFHGNQTKVTLSVNTDDPNDKLKAIIDMLRNANQQSKRLIRPKTPLRPPSEPLEV